MQSQKIRSYSVVLPLSLGAYFLACAVFGYDVTQTQMIITLKNNEQRITALEQQTQYLVNNTTTKQLSQLQQIVANLQQSNATLQNEIISLKQQISADRAHTQKSLETIVNKIAKNTTIAVNNALNNNKPNPRRKSNTESQTERSTQD